jgi:hypothetical protein
LPQIEAAIRVIRGKKSLRDRTEKIGVVVISLIRVYSHPFAVKKAFFAV